MKQLKKLNFEDFQKKYKGRTHISCGIHFTDGTMLSVQNMSFPYVEYAVKSGNKELSYIAIF